MQAVSLSNSTLGLNQTEQTELAMHIFFVFTGYSPEKWNGRFTRVDCLWFVPPEGQMTDEVKTSSAIRAYWQDWGVAGCNVQVRSSRPPEGGIRPNSKPKR